VGLTVIDAGVIIAHLDRADAHHDAAREALTIARQRGDALVVPASAYAEILVAPLRARPAQGDLVDGFLDALPATVEPANRTIARRAAELRALHGARIRLPDALVIATAAMLGADRILTTDSGWPKLDVPVEIVRGASRS
jgi:predicted nucleic acid-binding protein